MSTFSKRRLDEISREVIVGEQYDVKKVPFSNINETLWLEDFPSGCTVSMFPSNTGMDSYYLWVAKPTEGDVQHA